MCVFVQVTALVKLKECEDTHLGEEVDRNWAEVVTQQYVFDRLNREVRIHTCIFPLYALRKLVLTHNSFFYFHMGIVYLCYNGSTFSNYCQPLVSQIWNTKFT